MGGAIVTSWRIRFAAEGPSSMRSQPGNLQAVLDDPTLSQARSFVQEARSNHIGIFDTANPLGPLGLEPFELRFLARRNLPHRWVKPRLPRRS